MSTHDTVVTRLSDYLDEEDLSPEERVEIEAHLVSCVECRTVLAELTAVAARAKALPHSTPQGDLWPGIASQIENRDSVLPFTSRMSRRFSFTLPQLVAAGLALMVLSGGMVWIVRDNPRATLPPVAANVEDAGDPADPSAAAVPIGFADSYYDQAVADLERTLEEGRSRLDAETVRTLEESLLAIDRALDESRKALRDDPANVYLNNHFVAFRNRKLALLRRAAALAETQATAGS
jgi:hypothetical protein